MLDSERRLLELAREGDAQAFSRLVDMYAKPVYNLCYRMLGNPQDAEDAAQEAFLRSFRALHRYDPQRKFATWLLSIAANYCIDQHRRVRPQWVALDDVAQGELRERTPGPEGRAIAGEMSDDVQRILTSLKPKDRAAIILYYWYEYSYAEIARELAITETALKARMHRARHSLAELWQEEFGEPLFAKRRSYEEATP